MVRSAPPNQSPACQRTGLRHALADYRGGEQLEVFPDEPIVRRGRWVFDGNDSLLLLQRNIMRREALLVYERDLEFEVIYPPAFVATPQMGVGG